MPILLPATRQEGRRRRRRRRGGGRAFGGSRSRSRRTARTITRPALRAMLLLMPCCLLCCFRQQAPSPLRGFLILPLPLPAVEAILSARSSARQPGRVANNGFFGDQAAKNNDALASVFHGRRRRRTLTTRLEATSSSDLKGQQQRATNDGSKSTNTGTGPKKKESVVKRLKRAAARAAAVKAAAAAAAKDEEEKSLKQQRQEERDGRPRGAPPPSPPAEPHYPSLRELTRSIDRQLLQQQAGAGVATGWNNNPMQRGVQQPPPDSMGAIFSHNQRSQPRQQPQQQQSTVATPSPSSATSKTVSSASATNSTTIVRHVAVLLAKPLQDDQITVEGAARVKLLVKSMMMSDGGGDPAAAAAAAVVPDLICFVGGTSGDNRVSDADATYLYFRHLCASQKVPLRMPMHVERRSVDAALPPIVQHVQQRFLPGWLEEVQQLRRQQQLQKQQQQQIEDPVATGANAANNPTKQQPKRKNKLQIHFSLVSSEYQLCQLNDIHARSPNQSVLRAFSGLSKLSTGVEARWSYRYITTTTALPFAGVSSSDYTPLRAFCAKTYRTAQQLVPVLYNLRGVVKLQEFLQRDNYKVLVAARRSLVADAEGMYRLQPSLQAVHQSLPHHKPNAPDSSDSSSGSGSNNKPLDVVLESALLSLGRCLDLVRPAGLLTGSVSSEDFKRALTSLQQAYYLLDRACDPDTPLDPGAWGLLDDNGGTTIETAAEFSTTSGNSSSSSGVGADGRDEKDGKNEKHVTLSDLLQ